MKRIHPSTSIGYLAALAALVALGCGSDSRAPRPEADVVETIRTALTTAGGDSSTSSASLAEPTGFGTLRGTFKLNGEPPAPTTLSITKDEAVCAPGGKAVLSSPVDVDPQTNGIANVLLYADGVPDSWVHPDAQPGNTDEVIFDQKECVFLTRLVAMQTTQKLRVLNSDPVGHNLMVATFNQTIPSGGFAIYEPLKQQRSPVEMRCAVHPWMQAWFINRDNGYFAVTQSDGSFEIPNLPAGVELELRVWQPAAGPITTVTLDGQPAKWSKGKMKLTLEPDSEQTMDVVLDASIFQ